MLTGLPLRYGEFRLSFGVFRSSLRMGDEKVWFGLPSAWNELQSSEVGVTDPGLKNVSSPSPKSGASVDSPGLSSGLVGALVLARRGLPAKNHLDVV